MHTHTPTPTPMKCDAIMPDELSYLTRVPTSWNECSFSQKSPSTAVSLGIPNEACD